MTTKELRQFNINARTGKKKGQPSLHYSPKYGYFYQNPQGKRTLPPSQAEVDSRAIFKGATQNLKQLTPEQLAALYGYSYGSAWTWKDLAMSYSYGRSYEIHLSEGGVIYGARDLADQIQALLDSLGSEVGSLLVRSYDLWSCQRAGVAGYVYTSNGPGQVPTWQPSTGSGGSGDVQTEFGIADMLPGAGLSFTTGYIRVLGVWLPEAKTIEQLKLWATAAAATCKIVPVIYDRSGNNPGALIRKGPQITGVTSGLNSFAFDSAWTVPAEGLYYFGFQQTTAAVSLAKGVLRPYCYAASTGAIPDPFPAFSTSPSEAIPAWLSTEAL